MDRETRLFAESHFRGLRGRLPGGVCPTPDCVDFIENPDSFSYADFFKGYLLPNVPCVFSSAFTETWGSRRHWVTPSGKPNFDYLLRNYGDVLVPVANCGVREYNSNPKEYMPLREYINYWKEYIHGDYSSPRGCLYLKDWHLCRDSSAEGVFTLPVYFSSDWLNEYWDALGVDDYRFIYMGPTGTWSPFHADIFRSFSWSVNICGRKKWFFFPPGQEEALRDGHGGLPYDVTSPGLLNSRPCPLPLEVTQEAGEMVFVPSGWHHQVHNLQELCAVQQEVGQWRDAMPDWHHHCQVIMRSCSGINFGEFYHFLKVIAERRLLILAKGMGPEVEGGEDSGPGPQQAAFDVSRIAEVLASVVAHPDFQKVDTCVFSPRPAELLQQLEEGVVATASL
ncbi:2-oxoglutarate and iron-dependent oxygenase JMJD4 isoform X1 [Manis pentadactyla]|uniref:2-oxoglutarate and iron-dependent oxygenase JMJD4 isoform X1 n=1 Tax=Manis pentadactyla TaxID=143292 RepID=UPI00255C75BB|nr:2-oxoglutarate and iron-dependent oxygenase JMJD4 isoform X1 [Manis pentadactyla]